MIFCRFVLAVALATGWFVFAPAESAQAQRKLAPGVLKVIEPQIDIRDTHSLPMALPGLDVENYDPATFSKAETLFAQTRQVVFFRDIHHLEFAFLPLRQMKVTARDENGEPRERIVWYLVYRIRNTGAAVSYKEFDDPRFGHIDRDIDLQPTEIDESVLPGRFFGNLVLGGWAFDPENNAYAWNEYDSQVVPKLHQIIAREEDPDQEYLDLIEMAQHVFEPVAPENESGGKWGIALWYNVDPSLDFVTLKVRGLTNAYRLEHNPDGSIDQKYRTLQLNFYRPGDGLQEARDPIIYGIPLTDSPTDQAEIATRYQLPGPVIRGEYVNQDNLRTSVLFESDAEINPRNFESAVAAQLDSGNIPENVSEGFSFAGTPLGGDAKVTTDVQGLKWTVEDTWEGKARKFVIRLYPEFWEKTTDGQIRLIKRLDYLWVYE